MGKRYVKRIDFQGQDYTAEFFDTPDSCPRCGRSSDQMTFIIGELEPEDFFESEEYPVHNRRAGLACPYCNALVTGRATVHLYEVWVTEEMTKIQGARSYSADTLEDIITIRRILSHIDLLGDFTKQEPSNELIAEAFLPGSLRGDDIWIANGASVHPIAQLNPPLLVGNQCTLAEGAICGPRAMIVNNSFVNKGSNIAKCLLVESEVRLYFKDVS